jgi:epoxyqueuosine reductase
MLDEALAALEARGHRAAAVPIRRLDELREHYEDLARRGLLDASLAQDLLKGLTLRPPDAVPHPSSLIVVASRDPVVRCTFRWRGNDVSIPVPPTYLHYRRESEEVERALGELLPLGCRLASLLNAPHKLLAVRSGLARYGRSNVSYIPDFGSFYRLTTVCTDLPCADGEWSAPSMMPTCEACTRCVSACPTGAIPEDRFLLRGELCITYWNEKPGDVAFPEWLAGGWHDSLVGCLHCQLACPENAAVLDHQETGPCFTEDETEALLRGGGPDDLDGDLREKLESWDLLAWLGVLPRNLAVHLSEARVRPAPTHRRR